MGMAAEEVVHLPKLGISTNGHIFPQDVRRHAVWRLDLLDPKGSFGPLDDEDDEDDDDDDDDDASSSSSSSITIPKEKDKTKKNSSSFLSWPSGVRHPAKALAEGRSHRS